MVLSFSSQLSKLLIPPSNIESDSSACFTRWSSWHYYLLERQKVRSLFFLYASLMCCGFFFVCFVIWIFVYFCSSVDELRKLLSDKDAYQQFLLSLDQVKIQNNVSLKNTLKLFIAFISYVLILFTGAHCFWFLSIRSKRSSAEKHCS